MNVGDDAIGEIVEGDGLKLVEDAGELASSSIFDVILKRDGFGHEADILQGDTIVSFEIFSEDFDPIIVVEREVSRAFDGLIATVAEFLQVFFDVNFRSGEGLFGIFGAKDAAVFVSEPFGIFVDDGLADIVNAKVFEDVIFVDGGSEMKRVDFEGIIEGLTVEAGEFKGWNIGTIIDVSEADTVIVFLRLNFVDPFHVDGESVDEGEILLGCAGGLKHFVGDEFFDETKSFVDDPIIDGSGGREWDT